MKCHDCGKSGSIGVDLMQVPDGMVPGIQMKRYKVLCAACRDKQEQKQDEPQYPF